MSYDPSDGPESRGSGLKWSNPGFIILILNVAVIVFGAGGVISQISGLRNDIHDIKTQMNQMTSKDDHRALSERVLYLERLSRTTPLSEESK